MTMMLLSPSVMRAQDETVNQMNQPTQMTPSAQTTQTVRGQVCDVASGEPMIGVTITVEDDGKNQSSGGEHQSSGSRVGLAWYTREKYNI